MGALAAIGTAIGAANPAISAIGTVAGFFTSFKERKKAKRMRRAQKRRALKTESRLFGAAENVVQDFALQRGFLSDEYDMGKEEGILNYGQKLQDFQNMSGQQGFARSGAMDKTKNQITDTYSRTQEQMGLQYDQGVYGINRQEESELRDIQGSLYELSGITGSNRNVLDMITKTTR